MDYIRRLTERYWATEVRTAEFVRIAAGKEIGHKIGDMVDEKTTRLLKDCGRFDIRHQQSRGQAAGRSMGDLWLEAGFIYNPVNIKAGEYGKNGQPNLVSLKRVLVALAGCLIDSYYLLIMKVGQTASGYEPHVYFVDMLDFLDYTVFNSGPGQMMLREAHFYPAVDALYQAGLHAPEPTLSLSDKVEKLYGMLERADQQLYSDRERVRAQIQEACLRYRELPDARISRSRQEITFDLG